MPALVLFFAGLMAFQGTHGSSDFDRPLGTYFVKNNEGQWQLGGKAMPLVNRRSVTVYANVEHETSTRSIVYIREFAPEYKLDTIYVFDELNALRDMRCEIRDPGSNEKALWIGKASMHWSGKESGVPYAIHYFDPRRGNEITPPFCQTCQKAMESQKVYHTMAELPFVKLIPQEPPTLKDKKKK